MKYFLFNSVLFLILLANYDIQAQDRLYHNEFPLQDVTLLDGPFKHARDLNIQTLLKYDIDRLLVPFRKEAGLPVKALLLLYSGFYYGAYNGNYFGHGFFKIVIYYRIFVFTFQTGEFHFLSCI